MNENLQSYPFQGLIWAIRPNNKCNSFGIQLRFPELKVAKYTTIQPQNANELAVFTVSNSWWTELLATTEAYLIIGGYANPSMPTFSRLAVFDILNGKELWKCENFQYIDSDENMIIGIDLTSNETRILNILDGSEYHDLEHTINNSNENLKFPKWHKTEDNKSDLYYFNQGIEIFAWHEQKGDSFDLILEAGLADEPILSILLERGLEKLHPEPYFIAGDYLIAIQNKNTLIAWEIPSQ